MSVPMRAGVALVLVDLALLALPAGERAGAYERLRAAKEAAMTQGKPAPTAPSEGAEPASEASAVPRAPAAAPGRIASGPRPTEGREPGSGAQPPPPPAAAQGPSDTARRLLDAKRRARGETKDD